jgi:hypothetical protein
VSDEEEGRKRFRVSLEYCRGNGADLCSSGNDWEGSGRTDDKVLRSITIAGARRTSAAGSGEGRVAQEGSTREEDGQISAIRDSHFGCRMSERGRERVSEGGGE